MRAKASWVKRVGLLGLAILIIVPDAFGNLGTFIDYSSSSSALAYSTERKLVYDGANYWAFYNNGTITEYARSTNLSTWTLGGDLWGNTTINGASDVKVYGSSKIYACAVFDIGGITDGVVFKTGNISGTTITWGSNHQVKTYNAGGAQKMFSCGVSYDGTSYFVSISWTAAVFIDFVWRSTDNGATWINPKNDALASSGDAMISMAGGRAMTIRRIRDSAFPLNTQMYSWVWSGAAWGAAVQVNTDKVGSDPTGNDGSFSAIADGLNQDIVHVAYLNRTGNVGPYTYNIAYVYYQSGWKTAVNVESNVASTSQPTISYDGTLDSVIVAWMNNSIAYEKTFYFHGNSSWGSKAVIGNPSSPIQSYLIGAERRYNNVVNYLVENGAGVPYNVTVLTYTVSTTTTSTTATVTTLTTQTTTADTIVDAVANQFAAIMENLFPALIIILVFVYLAYKAGASGEVLAYVFIITLVLTSFINLMPWWITVIVSVIMLAILLNYRQRGGGVPQ